MRVQRVRARGRARSRPPTRSAQLADECRAAAQRGLDRRRLRARVHARARPSRRCWPLAKVAAEFGVPCFFHGRYSAVGTNAADPRRDHRDRQGDRRRGPRRAHHQHRRHLRHGGVAGPGRRRPATEGHDVTRLHVPVRLLGHLPRLAPLRRRAGRSGSASPTSDLQVAGTDRAAHRGDLRALRPGRGQPARRRVRHPRGRRRHLPRRPRS